MNSASGRLRAAMERGDDGPIGLGDGAGSGFGEMPIETRVRLD